MKRLALQLSQSSKDLERWGFEGKRAWGGVGVEIRKGSWGKGIL